MSKKIITSAALATLLACAPLTVGGTAYAAESVGNPPVKFSSCSPAHACNHQLDTKARSEGASTQGTWEIKRDKGTIKVSLFNAEVRFIDGRQEPVVKDRKTGLEVNLPRYIESGDVAARVLYVPIDSTHFEIHYLTDRFHWGCYTKGVVGGLAGGVASGAAGGAVSGLAFVPVAPATITGGAIVGGVTGLVGGVVGGVFICW